MLLRIAQEATGDTCLRVLSGTRVTRCMLFVADGCEVFCFEGYSGGLRRVSSVWYFLNLIFCMSKRVFDNIVELTSKSVLSVIFLFA